MDHTLLVSCVQGPADLLNDCDRLFWTEFFLLAEEGLQILTLDVFHADELRSLGVSQVKNADHVLVRDLPSQD